MATNGKTGLRAPPGSVMFVIGGEEIVVPALTLYVLDAKKDALRSLGPDLSMTEYGVLVIEIIAEALKDSRPELTQEELLRHCSWPETLELPARMAELLTVSGFTGSAPGEVEAASPGTGTSTNSPPNSPVGESATETPLESSEP